MLWYIGRRLLQTIPVFIGATLLIYFLVFKLPGDPVAALFGDKPVNLQVAARIRAEYHLDRPFFTQYLLYLKGILTLDFGTTFSGQPVLEVLKRVFPVTIRLALLALCIEAVFGIVVGVFAGLRKGGIFDGTVLIASLLLIAVPVFVLAFVLQFVIGIKLGWAQPTAGPNARLVDLILPAIVLSSLSVAYVLRLTRASVSENLNADFVKTARAKGLSKGRVIRVHVLRNSLIPVVTFLGADLGQLMAGAIVTEGIFNVQGVGRELYQATIKSESVTVVSVVSVLVVVFLISNLLVDLLYAVLDPRIRYA